MVARFMGLRAWYLCDDAGGGEALCQFGAGEDEVDAASGIGGGTGKAALIRVQAAKGINVASLQEEVDAAARVDGTHPVDNEAACPAVGYRAYGGTHSAVAELRQRALIPI